MMNEKKYNIILLPTYNEKENIKKIIPEIFALQPEIKILVIDDNSPDGTANEVKALMLKYKNLDILRRKIKNGLGQAYIEGIKKIIGLPDIEAIITMDADGSHDPKYLKQLTEEIKKYDLVIGSRYVKNGAIDDWNYWRRLLSAGGNIYSKILTGLPISDLTAGFAAIKKTALQKLDLNKLSSTGYAFQIELKFNLINISKATFTEIPIVFKERILGESKITKNIILEGIFTPWKLLFKKLLMK